MNVRNVTENLAGSYDCEIEHPTHGWIPFTASSDDLEPLGQEIYQAIVAGGHGTPAGLGLQILKDAKKSEIERARDAGRHNPGATVTTADGITWQVDPTSRQELNDALTTFGAIGGTPAGFTWRDTANVDHPADLALLASVAAARAEQVNAIWKESWALKAQVDAAADQTELDTIVVPTMLTGEGYA